MAYRHILVPFDSSPLATAALSLATWLAWKGGGELDLLRAVTAPRTPFTPRPLPGMARLEAMEEAQDLATAKNELAQEADRARRQGLPVTGVAQLGDPVTVILEYIRRAGIDLVVMGTHGRPLLQRWILGSVASETARRSPVPVLLAPREFQLSRDDELRVLVALDESATAELALRAAVTLAATVPAGLTLFQVFPGEAPEEARKTLNWYRQPVLGASSYLEDVRARLAGEGVNCQCAYSAGSPVSEVLDFAVRGKFEVIAVGTHGRTGLDRLVMGSVAEGILERSPVPVLVTSPAVPAAGPIPAADRAMQG